MQVEIKMVDSVDITNIESHGDESGDNIKGLIDLKRDKDESKPTSISIEEEGDRHGNNILLTKINCATQMGIEKRNDDEAEELFESNVLSDSNTTKDPTPRHTGNTVNCEV